MSNRDGNGEIYVARGGGEWVNLTNHPAGDNWPEWSPDGTRIAFQSRRSGNLDIWVMNADGSDPRQLTDDPEPDYLPAWAPDGRRITFSSWRREAGDAERANHVYVMSADGSDQRRLVPETLGTSAGAAWSADGARMVVSRAASDDGADLHLLAADGSHLRRLTDDPPYDGAAVFSPDGARLAYYADHGDRSELVVLDLASGERRVVLGEGKNWYPRWSPDGRWLVYTAPARPGETEDLDLFAVPADGSAPPLLLVGGPAREAEGRWRPAP